MPRSPVRILFYAINGTGLGHVARLLAIARNARELVKTSGARADFQFLTTSDGSEIIHDFPVFKVPSKSAAVKSGVDRAEFVARSKFLISNLVAQFRPDVLVVDTVPQGAYQEFAFLRAYARTTLLIDRHKDHDVASSDIVQLHTQLYDRVIVPDWESESARYPAPPSIRTRRRFVGPVHGYDPSGNPSRQEVRRYFDVDGPHRLVYVSAGGGGDQEAPAELRALVDAFAIIPDVHLLVGYGPLFRGERIYRRNVTPLSEPDISRYFGALDAAVCAAGYNTYQELLAAGVPTLFFAQRKGMDRQDERVQQGARSDFHDVFDRSCPLFDPSSADPDELRQKLIGLLEGVTRQRLLRGLGARKKSIGALRSAVELLALHSTLPDSALDRRRLYEVATLRRAFRGDDNFEAVAGAFLTWRSVAATRAANADATEDAASGWKGDPSADAASGPALGWGATLLRRRAQSGYDEEKWNEFLKAFCSDGSPSTEPERRQRLDDALAAIAEHFGAEGLGAALDRLTSSVSRAALSTSLSRVAAELDARPDACPDDVLAEVVG